MAEQERPKETPIQFPKVPKEIVFRFLEQFNYGLNEEWDSYRLPDPISRCVDEVYSGPEITDEERRRAFLGATFAHLCFKALGGEEGIILSPVNDSVVDTYLEELRPDLKIYLPYPIEELTTDEVREITKSQSPEFDWDNPSVEENPFFMWAIEFHDSNFKIGAIVVYELYKRQWHTERLRNGVFRETGL